MNFRVWNSEGFWRGLRLFVTSAIAFALVSVVYERLHHTTPQPQPPSAECYDTARVIDVETGWVACTHPDQIMIPQLSAQGTRVYIECNCQRRLPWDGQIEEPSTAKDGGAP